MVSRLNKVILICCLLLLSLSANAQDEISPDSVALMTDTSEYSAESYESESGNYQEWYHFSDSDQTIYNHQKLNPKFDKTYWLQTVKNMRFEEDKDTEVVEKKEKVDKKTNKLPTFNLPDFKTLFIIIALIVLIIVVYYLIKNTNLSNKKINTNILVNFNDLDEQGLKEAELNIPLITAIKNGDYKTAYRIKYLMVLKQLIDKNLIVYKKEKTNTEYLMQLSGRNLYEPFRMLTFNFDGIWYGELFIDEAGYNALLPYFTAFEEAFKNA